MRYPYLFVFVLATSSFLSGQPSKSGESRLQRLKMSVDNIIASQTEPGFVTRSIQTKEMRSILTEKALTIDYQIASEQLHIINTSDSVDEKLQALSSFFRLAHTQDERNPFIDSLFTVCSRQDILMSSVSTMFPSGAVPESSVSLHAIKLQSPKSILFTTILEAMENTSASIRAIPTDNPQQCLLLVYGHDLKKMQYHERAVIYEYDSNGLRLLWRSGYLQAPEFNIVKGSIVIKQSVNLVGGDFSSLAAEYPDFKGYATRTLTIAGASISESAPSLRPVQ